MDTEDNLPLSIPLLPLKEFLACPICMCEFDKTYITPCGHRYCEKCIRECINRRHKCPCCNAAVQDNQLIKDSGYDGLIAMINKEKGKAEDGYFNNLIRNAATGDANNPDDTIQREISPIEDVLQKHLKQGLASFELYYRELRKDFELRIKEAEISIEVALADLQVTSSMGDEQPNQAAQDAAAAARVQECENRRQHLEKELEACTKLLVESYDKHLSEHVPAPALLPVNISIVLHGKTVTLKDVKLKPHDSLSILKEIVIDRMQREGDPVVIFPDDGVKYVLVGPFAKNNGTLPVQTIERVASGEMAVEAAEGGSGEGGVGAGAKDITLLPPGCYPVLEYAVKPASSIVLIGPIKLESEMPKKCFVKVWKQGGNEKMDYFTCKQCKINWVCKSCRDFCHKGHKMVPYVSGHTPTWACCH
ncbi:uncharacterized protein [Amphiura filiformis]|uniref:uncharacterized protein n=1 Tax=Amphiura filiformis TaxID=82378 RepID=UPI003B216B2B